MDAQFPVSLSRLSEITERTGSLIYQICSFPGFGVYPNVFLPKPGQPISNELKEFADYVVLFEQQNLWGSEGYPELGIAVTLPLFQVSDIRSVDRQDLDGYGSWLYHGAYLGTYSVVFDGREITRLAAQFGNSPEAMQFRLFVHELGHLIFHREKIFRDIPVNERALNASAEFEAEAWLFAGIFTGLCIGDNSYQAKILGQPDKSFLIL